MPRAGDWPVLQLTRLGQRSVFVLSWLVQLGTGFTAYAEEQLTNFQNPGTWANT